MYVNVFAIYKKLKIINEKQNERKERQHLKHNIFNFVTRIT